MTSAQDQDQDGVTKKGVTRYTLCGVFGCCPTVEVNHEADRVVIKDDFGGVVTLTTDEWRDALAKVQV